MKTEKSDLWISLEQKAGSSEWLESQDKEFGGSIYTDDKVLPAVEGSRRDFLKFLGFGLGAATIAAGCETPMRKAIPYVIKPDEIVPGVATYYASTFVNGGDYCPVLVKTREGRPIKIEGNSMSAVTGGGTSARAQASVLELYDTNRLRHAGKIV